MKISKKEWIAVAAGLVLVGVMFGFGPGNFFFTNFTNMTSPQQDQAAAAVQGASVVNEENINMENANDQLGVTDVVEGTGDTAVAGSMVVVNYRGTFADGSVFDSSYDRGIPFEFRLGTGEVILGWDQGVAGMKEGGKRRLVVPPTLGYGPADYGPIPGNSTLFFEVELIEVK